MAVHQVPSSLKEQAQRQSLNTGPPVEKTKPTSRPLGHAASAANWQPIALTRSSSMWQICHRSRQQSILQNEPNSRACATAANLRSG